MFISKVLLIVAIGVVGLTSALPNEEVPVLGGPSKLSGDRLKDAEKTLNESLTKLAAGDGPSYELGKVLSASVQVVSGSLYKYEVELIDSNKATKKCNVEIWSQSWLENGIQVTFDCPGEEKLVKKHSA